MQRFAAIVLALAGLGFLGFGAAITLDPAGVLATVGISGTPAGEIELRAFYGGLELGLGAFLLACAWCPAWRRPGLWLVLGVNGGIAAVRLLGIAQTGEYIPFFTYALAWELGFSALAGLALWLGRKAG